MKSAIVLFAALMLATPARGATLPETDCIYDYRFITEQECRDYRAQVLAASSDEERLVLLNDLRKTIHARAQERGVPPTDWRGLAVAPMTGEESAMTGWAIALFMAGLAAMVAFAVHRQLRPVRNMRLMRCPDTEGIAFVEAGSVSNDGGTAAELTVWSCELWPGKKDCSRGCLARYDQTAPGYRINVEALRPFKAV